jgi:glycosyltransferase involved in cell wall biosynthesis
MSRKLGRPGHAPVHRPRVAFVVNAQEGIGVRRADEFARRLAPDLHVDIFPGANRVPFEYLAFTQLVYVIDAGRRGFPAAVRAKIAGRLVVVELGDPQRALYRADGRGHLAVAAGGLIDWLTTRRATAVVVRGRGLAAELSVRVPWIEIPDGVDIDMFRADGGAAVRAKLDIPRDALVVGLVGSLAWSEQLGMGYGWDVTEALAFLRDEPVVGLIVGDGPGVQRLRTRAAELRVSEKLLLPGRVAHRAIPRYLSAMDVCVSTQSNDSIGRSRTTAKLPEYLACDRYVLATAVGAAAEVLPDEMLLPFHGHSDREHPARLADRIRTLVPRRQDLRAGAGTRAIAVDRYDYDLLADRLKGFLCSLIGGAGPTEQRRPG